MADLTNARTPGELLTAARTARGLSLDEVAAATKISARLLVAMERDEYHKISGSLYVRSFLRTYAEELGVDAHELVALFDQQSGRGEAPSVQEQVWEEEATVRTVGVPYGRVLVRYVIPAVLVIVVVVVALWLGRRPQEPAQSGAATTGSLLADSVDPSAAAPNTLAVVVTDSLAAGAGAPIDTTEVRAGGAPFRPPRAGEI